MLSNNHPCCSFPRIEPKRQIPHFPLQSSLASGITLPAKGKSLKEDAQECLLTPPLIPVVHGFVADPFSPWRQDRSRITQKVKFNSSNALPFLKNILSLYLRHCSHGRVNGAGAGLSAGFDTELKEIYVCGGGGGGKEGPSVHFKIQTVDLLQRGPFKLKEAKLSLASCLESLEFWNFTATDMCIVTFSIA